VIAGPKSDYPVPIVNALKTYVEAGGRVLFLLDTPLRLGEAEPPSDNSDLLKLLADWGVTANKDLALDLSGVDNYSVWTEVPFIVGYESHPITEPLRRVPTAYPLSRSLDTQSGSKATLSKLVATTEASVATTSISARGAVDPTKGKKGPLTLAVAGTLTGSPQGRLCPRHFARRAKQHCRFAFARQPRPHGQYRQLALFRRRSDLHSPEVSRRSPAQHDNRRLTATFWLSVVVFRSL